MILINKTCSSGLAIHLLVHSRQFARTHINKFQSREMKREESDDSQNQGFHRNMPCIDAQKRKQEGRQSKLMKSFQPRYLAGSGIMKKQPKECHHMSDDIPNKNSSLGFCPDQLGQSITSTSISAYELYNNPSEYSLVYSRNKEPFSLSGSSIFQNQINLKACQENKQDSYKILKEFQFKCELQRQKAITFDSKFESGNLLCAFKSKKEQNSYSLFMQNDTNTNGYNQWFYFSIRNAKPKTKYTFKIANYRKSYSMFKLGLKPLIFSMKLAQKDGSGWYRDGQNIRYYKSKFSQQNIGCYYTLQFTLQFENENDLITLSPYAPYSYSKMMRCLQTCEMKAFENNISWKLRSIARSLTNTQVPYITISKNGKSSSSCQTIVIMARQHPGETWSSYLVEALLKEIVEQTTQYSKWILDRYVIKVFPMVNVDGVIYGNFRCDIAGYDLNRVWKSPYQSIHPQIAGIKAELQKINERNGIALFLDLHTHSKQFGAFAYCCIESQKCREYPSILSKITPIFRYSACTFGISADKQSTARASIFYLAKTVNTITIQLSSFGFRQNVRESPIMFAPLHIRQIGKALLGGFYYLVNKQQPQCKQEEREKLKVNDFIQMRKQEQVQGSDSEPQVDEIQIKERMNKIFPQIFIQDLASSLKNNKKVIKRPKKSNSFQHTKPAEKPPLKKQKITLLKKSSKYHKTEAKPVSYASVDNVDDHQASKTPTHKQSKLDITSRQTGFFQQPQYKKSNKLYPERVIKAQAHRQTKPLNLIEFSLKRLPLVPQEKIQPPSYFLDQSSPSLGAVIGGIAYAYAQRDQNRFDKTFSTYEAMCRPRIRANSRKIGLGRQKNHQLQQQLPFLCVMSQNKKLLHFDSKKQKIEQYELQPQKEIRIMNNSFLNVNKNRRIVSKQKAMTKYPIDFISRMNEQFARYDQFVNTRKRI